MEDDQAASIRSLPYSRDGSLPQRLRTAPLTRREPGGARRQPTQHPRQLRAVRVPGVRHPGGVPAQGLRRQDAHVQQIHQVCCLWCFSRDFSAIIPTVGSTLQISPIFQ